jgi:putative DNA primase/helicase
MDISSIEECIEVHPKTGFVTNINYNLVARWVLTQIPVATVVETKEMLIYHNGKYNKNGREVVHRLLVSALSPFMKETGQTCYSKHLFDEVLSIIKGLTYVHIAKFDSNLDIINVENGLLNWRTMELTPHDPEYYSQIQIPVKYDPDSTCSNIMKMLKTILRPEDMDKALEFIAYCLYRSYPIQKVFILLGPGSTGKSHFIDVVQSFLGIDNTASVSMHDLEKDRFATADLYNKLCNTFGDMEQTELPNVNILKMLTSNKDMIRAQKKNEHAFGFINFSKFLFATNKLARVRDDSSGFYRRVEILAFEHVFKQEDYDPKLLSKVTSPQELSGLLNLVLPYLGPLLERNEFSNSFNAATAQDRYKVASEPIRMFIESHIREIADAVVAKDVVYSEYVKFCDKNGVKPVHPVWFGRSYRRMVPWCRDSIRDFGGIKRTCWLNTQLILGDLEKLND